MQRRIALKCNSSVPSTHRVEMQQLKQAVEVFGDWLGKGRVLPCLHMDRRRAAK